MSARTVRRWAAAVPLAVILATAAPGAGGAQGKAPKPHAQTLQPSHWAPDPLFLAKLKSHHGYWWRDTTNQNALIAHNDAIWPPDAPPAVVQDMGSGVYFVKTPGGNVTALIGDTEWVLIDSTDWPPRMQLVLLMLRPYIGTRKLKALIYTSSHFDHVSGSFIVAPPFSIRVYANASIFDTMSRRGVVAGAYVPRMLKTIGVQLEAGPDGSLGTGWGLGLMYGKFPFQYPSVLVNEPTSVNIAGFDIELYPSPSASADGLWAWLPASRILVAGDAIDESFPETAPLAEPVCPIKAWIATLDAMRAKDALALLPARTRAVVGEVEVDHALGTYRDALQYVHDRTVALINTSNGAPPEDLAAQVQLPDALAADPYLQEFALDVPATVRGVYQEYLGWFGGEPPELSATLTTERRAGLVVELAGGRGHMLNEVRQAVLAVRDQSSAEKALFLAWTLYRSTPAAQASDAAKEMYVEALRRAAYLQKSGEIRNYYLTTALMVETTITP